MIRLLIVFVIVLVGCGNQDEESGPQLIEIMSVDTVVDTESGAIGYAVDVAPSGHLYIADYQANHVLVIGPTGERSVLGRPGEGPGEFASPYPFEERASRPARKCCSTRSWGSHQP